jgi:hypothetical protein
VATVANIPRTDLLHLLSGKVGIPINENSKGESESSQAKSVDWKNGILVQSPRRPSYLVTFELFDYVK